MPNAVNGRMRRRPVRARRGGAIALEFLIAFPVLVIATLAVVEFGILLVVRHTVTAAAIDGARHAGQAGATTDTTAARVRAVLRVHGLDFDPDLPATAGHGGARVVVEASDSALAGERGNAAIPCDPTGPSPAADEVRVTVCVPVTNAAGSRPVPNWLAPFGISLSGRTFAVSALARRE